MIRRHVLVALATGVEAGNDDAARAALAQTEWPLRGSARRELERALIDAALISRAMISANDPDEMRHVQRVAALSLEGNLEVDATQRDAVTDAYAKLPRRSLPTAPIATIAIVAAIVVAIGLLGLAIYKIRQPHRRERVAPTMPWGAFATGGVPRTDPAIEKLLVEDLPNYVIQSDQYRRGTARDRSLDLHDAPIIRAQGGALLRAWNEMISALDLWVDEPQHSRSYKAAQERLRSSTQAVTDQLAALGLGYHLEADVVDDHGAHGTIFVFRVEDVVYVHAGGEPRRVLSLRRLDRLNVAHTLLGMQTEELGDPVVLLDQIEEFVGVRIGSVVFHQTFTVGDPSFVQTTDGRVLAHRAGEAIARELVPFNRNVQAITRAVVATVRRHEARHGYDNDRDGELRYPDALAALAGDRHTHAAFVARARAELAAYTSQIASDTATPQLALWNLANLGFNKDRWGTAEAFVAVVVLEGLARELGVKPVGAMVRDGHLDRSRLAQLAAPLAAESDDDLRAAARRLWQHLYGEPLVAITDPGATL